MENTQIVHVEKAVTVSNVSPNANQKTVSDFFSFCGKISKLFMKKENDNSFNVVVEFETESAAKTALLLTNALIIDRPIVVTPYTAPVSETQTPSTSAPTDQSSEKKDSTTETHLGTQVPPHNITQREFQVPDEERSKTSVIVTLLSNGYVLGKDAIDSAKDLDEKHKISPTVLGLAEQVKTKAQEIDTQYGISDKVNTVTTAVSEKAKQIDDEYKLSEKAQQGLNAVKTEAESVMAKVQENPTVAKGVETIKSTAWSLTSTFLNAVHTLKEETQKNIDEIEKSRPHETKPVVVEGQTQPQTQPSSSESTTVTSPSPVTGNLIEIPSESTKN